MIDNYIINVAGVSFRQDAVAKAAVNDSCLLIPEPDNKFDANAVRVVLESTGDVVGYIPRQYSEVVAAAIASGIKLSTKVVHIGIVEDTRWLQIEISIN